MLMMNADEKYMRMALAEAGKALAAGEVPIGAVVVSHDRVIARAHNLTETLCDPTAHAEMQAITSHRGALRDVCRSHRLGTGAACGLRLCRPQAWLPALCPPCPASQGADRRRHPRRRMPPADAGLLPAEARVSNDRIALPYRIKDIPPTGWNLLAGWGGSGCNGQWEGTA